MKLSKPLRFGSSGELRKSIGLGSSFRGEGAPWQIDAFFGRMKKHPLIAFSFTMPRQEFCGSCFLCLMYLRNWNSVVHCCSYSKSSLDYFSWLHASTHENIDEWKWKLTMLIRNKDEQEVVSTEKKDRRDFEQISALATRMGLYSCQYSRVVVFSKVPLPNYRSDLDDKRPQREVVLPFGLQREVHAHLKEYLSQKSMSRESFSDKTLSRSIGNSSVTEEGFYEQQEPLTQTSVVMERILKRKSLRIRNQQQDWQVFLILKILSTFLAYCSHK
ncbi:DExH-box ATP-dependent RNA helicase DExH3 [Vitis vinifera]|uniref:DExH-box ATP-dependent RNA helicase DExH3 n=1 Tax=Vitis vinifera TaxID=29760 RepID=A0A438KA09_VITVI|nr:DExH-box ATP-dependent RNA helicase DExH3 [Vitis vinifera]